MMLMSEKETCHEMMDRSVEATIKCLGLVNQAVGDYCFAWGIAADDSGTQRGEFIRPELWAEMLKPHYKKLCDWIHANTAWKVFLHSCGSVYHLVPHFIEAGIDILNPVQTSAANMEPARLKQRVRRPAGLLGRRMRYPNRPRPRHAGGNPPARQGADRRLRPQRRLRVQSGPQHPGQRPAGKHPCHVRRGLRVRRVLERER